MKASTLTVKGQVTIPADIRARLGIKAGDRIGFVIEDDKAMIVPLTDKIEESFGVVRARRSVSLDEMEKAIRKRAGR